MNEYALCKDGVYIETRSHSERPSAFLADHPTRAGWEWLLVRKEPPPERQELYREAASRVGDEHVQG